MNVLLSIKPKYVAKILKGEKKYEFRKSIFKSKNVDRAYIYSSSPEKRIVGSFRIGRIIENNPKTLWESFSQSAGINEDEFFNYFEDRKIGFAIEITDLKIFKVPLNPFEKFESFTPPQNFCYLKDDFTGEDTESKKSKLSDFQSKTFSEDSHISRILSESEIEQLDNLLVPHLSRKYPNFEEWLERAKEDIGKGSRIAYGKWAYGKLVATIILRPTISNTVELKSLFVDPDFQKHGYGPQIYNVAEKQCLTMHFRKILVDTFCEDDDVIHFLITNGYTIYGKADIYSVGKHSYLLSKDLNPQYIGDPYDWEEISRWLIENYFDFEIVEDHPIVKGRALDFSIRRIINNKFQIKGLVEVKDTFVDQDPVMMLYQMALEGGFHIPIFVGRNFKRRSKEFAKDKGIVLIDEKDICEITGWEPPEIQIQDIRGILLPIKPEFYQKIVNKKIKNFVYLKGAPFGRYLKNGHKIIFYVERPRREVSAFGTVTRVSIDSPEIQWEDFGKKSVFDKKDFLRFSNSKNEILAIEVKDFQEIRPLDYSQIKKIIPPKMLSGSYIDAQVIEKLIGDFVKA